MNYPLSIYKSCLDYKSLILLAAYLHSSDTREAGIAFTCIAEPSTTPRQIDQLSFTFRSFDALESKASLNCKTPHPFNSSTTSMLVQSRQNVWRTACHARNAYNPVLALRAAFGTSASCLKDGDHLPSMWESPATPLLRNERTDHESITGRDETDVGKEGDSPKQKRAAWPMNKRKPGKQRDPRRRLPVHIPQLHTTNMPLPSQGIKGVTPVDFSNYNYWKRHMASIREESFRVRHSQWWTDEPDEQSMSHERAKNFLDYDAKVVQPEPSNLTKPLPMPWAEDENGRREVSVNSCLSSDINKFAAWMSPTLAEQRGRAAVVQETEELIRSVLTAETTGVELFGSEKNGIALPLSDIDIRIYDTDDPNMPHARLAPRLKRICKEMEMSDKFMLATVRSSGHPILNCQHRESGIDIQIVAADDATPQQEVVAKYIEEVPQLREVYFLVRTILSMRGLVDVFHGGLGSYGTFVMVLAILHRHMKHHRATYGEDAKINSASQLIAFLEFYRKLDTQNHAVAVHPRTLFKKHDTTAEALKAYSTSAEKRNDKVRAGQWELCLKRPFQPYLLCLQDPANPLNDLGKKGHAIKHIHATLAYLNQALAAGCLALKKWKQKQTADSSTLEPLLHPLVGRCHEVLYVRRKKLETYGRKLRVVPKGEVENEQPEGGPPLRRLIHHGVKITHEASDLVSNKGT